jgi:uncharacterized protein with von Willebrand factor type A (vWA) domain
MQARYSRWDGTQDPWEDLDVREVFEEMSDDLLSGLGARWAMRRLQQRGIQGRMRGLDELRRRLQEARRGAAERLNLSGPLEHVKQKLSEVVALERGALEERSDDDALMRQSFLDALPHHPAQTLRQLRDYDFVSPHAAARFQELMGELQRDVLNANFSNLAGALRGITPEELGRLKDMLADLNAMLAARAAGRPWDFKAFMSSYGDFFPENPGSLDELLEILARRAAALSRLVSGMSPAQRRELGELAAAVLDDLDLAFQVDQLTRALQELMPALPWGEPVEAWGEEAVPLSTAVDAIERLSDYEELEAAMAGDYAGATLDDIDEERLRRSLGDGAVADVERLKSIERALERTGVIHRVGSRLEITPRGARLLGERALTKVLERIRREPTHRARGGGAEATGQTRAWSFGDEDPISVQRTVYNAVTRSGPGRTVSLSIDDFEVVETESRPRTATALLLDLSFSMPLRGHWLQAKRMALALNALIEGKYPQDSLYLIGFSDYARQMQPAGLADAGWERVHGTNMEHAFILARRLLAEDPRAIKQVIMVTDGEPTAHLEEGCAIFNWPPVAQAIEKTLREAVRLSRSGISINVFMLDKSEELAAFMDRLAELTGGKTFLTQSDEIGNAVLREYLHARDRGRRAS